MCKSCEKKRINKYNSENREHINAISRKSKGFTKDWKVYIVFSKENNQFYIGMTCRDGKALANYFGSNKVSSSWEDRKKVIIYETQSKSEVRLMELILQLQFREDERCINEMLNIRTQAQFTKGLTDEYIAEILERTHTLLEMYLERRSSGVHGRDDTLLRLQLLLSHPEGEA